MHGLRGGLPLRGLLHRSRNSHAILNQSLVPNVRRIAVAADGHCGMQRVEGPERLLTMVAERICAHCKFAAANQWSFELCYGLLALADGMQSPEDSLDSARKPQRLHNLDTGWWIDREPRICLRLLRGVQDVAA